MFDTPTLRQFQDFLVDRAGGYLRNPVRQPRVTCSVCTTPVSNYLRCHACQSHVGAHGSLLADAVAPLTYAVRNEQSGYMMRGYKAAQAVEEHRVVVSVLTWLGMSLHTSCVGRKIGLPVTHWATVPSLPAKPGEHPFHRIVALNAPAAYEASLSPAQGVSAPRDVGLGHFAVAEMLPPRSHVLVVDDTWARGGHAQSAVLALRRAGATKVSVMVSARWINRDFGDNGQFVDRLQRTYDPQLCPWTGTTCPTE
jgi:hypothetical protein